MSTIKRKHQRAIAILDRGRDRLHPKPRKVGRSWWRDLVTDSYRDSLYAWEADREAVALGYETEQAEYELEHPRPTFRDVMVGLRGAS